MSKSKTGQQRIQESMTVRIARGLTFFLICLLLATGVQAGKPEKKGPIPVVVTQNPDNTWKIHVEKLVKRFKDGGKIGAFAVAKLDDGFYLMRYGLDAKGAERTEAIPLEKTERGFRPGGLSIKKISVCFRPECTVSDGTEVETHGEVTNPFTGSTVVVDDASIGTGRCNPNQHNNSCNCKDGSGECKFGIDTQLELYDVVIVGGGV